MSIRIRAVGALFAALAAFGLTVSSAAAELPRSYQVIRVDDPSPTTNGNFGLAVLPAGDINADGAGDVLVGTDKHGRQRGSLTLVNGRTGAIMRSYALPDADPGGAGERRAGFGAALGILGANNVAGQMTDLGSCPGGGSPGVICAAATIGPPDGVPDHLVSASGVDVGAINDVGVLYVFDGATGVLLKRIHMPPADRAEQGALGSDPRYGRTVMSPSSAFPESAPLAVKEGDLNGGGMPDIIVAATDYSETGGTGNCPASETLCDSVGRVYVFYGETIAGTNPATSEESPDRTILNPTTQIDTPGAPGGTEAEELGGLLIPTGDLGSCTSDPGPGSDCPADERRTVPDGRPDFVATSPSTNLFGMFDIGVAFLIDGADGSILTTYEHPEPQPGSAMGLAQNGMVWPAIGDVGQNAPPDVYVPSINQNGTYLAEGRGYFFNGNFLSRLRFRNFSLLSDPTPATGGQFGASAAGIGDVAADARNEILVGAIGPHAPGTNAEVINDVHIASALVGEPLQSIAAPDQQGGSGFGAGLAPMGDVNADGFLDFAVGAGLYDLTTQGGPCASSCRDAGRVYLFHSHDSPAPAPPVGDGPPPSAVAPAPAAPAPAAPVPDAVVGPFTAKLALARARILRRDRLVDVLAPITSLASGRAQVQLHAAGRRLRFTAPINSRDGRIRFRQPIPKAQADLGTGILTIDYRGDADTRPQTLRLRAASQRADLRLSRPTIRDGRLRASGTVSDRARGVVRVQIEYVAGGETHTRQFKAPIGNGKWSLDERLSQTVRTAIAQRTGTVHSYTLFTGYYPRRLRGEMRSYQVLAAR